LHAGDALDNVVHRLEVLDVQRRDDVDSRIEQLLDVLPPLLVPGPGNVRVRQLVDQRDVGMTRDNRVDVHLLELGAAVLDSTPAPELVTGATVVGVGDPPLVLAGGVVELLPQPASAAPPITTSARAVSLRFAIVDLR